MLLQSYVTVLNIDKKTLWSPKYTVFATVFCISLT